MRFLLALISIVGIIVGLSGCSTIPEGAEAVDDFRKEKYLGKWYEIARLDFTFERDLDNTTAEYTVREDGRVGVRNRGFNYKKREWKEAIGIAKFRGAETVGALEVSFFGPFFAPYNIIALDKDYSCALIAGKDTNYLWILARTREIPAEIKEALIAKAKSAGYKTADLIWVHHDSE